MSLTNDQLEDRIIEIEHSINELSSALSSLATQRQLNSLIAIIQPQLDSLSTDVESLTMIVSGYQPCE